MEEKDIYAVVLKSGQFSKYNSLDALKRVPESIVECFLRGNYFKTFRGPSNITSWYQFDVIDRDGNVIPYGIGDFEVAYMGPDDGCTNFFGRDVTIRNRVTDKCYIYCSHCYYNQFILKEIRPLLLQLNECQSEEEIQKALDAPKTYEQLLNENAALREFYERTIQLQEETKARL